MIDRGDGPVFLDAPDAPDAADTPDSLDESATETHETLEVPRARGWPLAVAALVVTAFVVAALVINHPSAPHRSATAATSGPVVRSSAYCSACSDVTFTARSAPSAHASVTAALQAAFGPAHDVRVSDRTSTPVPGTQRVLYERIVHARVDGTGLAITLSLTGAPRDTRLGTTSLRVTGTLGGYRVDAVLAHVDRRSSATATARLRLLLGDARLLL